MPSVMCGPEIAEIYGGTSETMFDGPSISAG